MDEKNIWKKKQNKKKMESLDKNMQNYLSRRRCIKRNILEKKKMDKKNKMRKKRILERIGRNIRY